MAASIGRDLDTEIRRVMEGIGRCLLIYQRIELYLKYLLPHVVGPNETPGDTFAQWRSLLDSKSTLGPLVERLRESIRSSDPKGFDRYIGELVEQRNQFIHHFSRQPFARLSNLEECDAALAHLDALLQFASPLHLALDGALEQFRDALLEAKGR
jgi:hypothetical protein